MPDKDVQEMYRVVESLMVVHNLCIDLDDHPMDWTETIGNDEAVGEDGGPGIYADVASYGGVTGDEAVEIPIHETAAALRAAGYAMRQELLDRLCPIDRFV